jgi:hypothetical protein
MEETHVVSKDGHRHYKCKYCIEYLTSKGKCRSEGFTSEEGSVVRSKGRLTEHEASVT